MERAEIAKLMAAQFGPDWESKAIVGPTGVIRLRDVFDEGWPPPAPAPTSSSAGLWQIMPPSRFVPRA